MRTQIFEFVHQPNVRVEALQQVLQAQHTFGDVTLLL